MLICARNPVRSALLAFAVLTALALAACGDDADSGGDGPDPATLAPADSVVYMDAVIRPEGDQKDGLTSALSKLGVDDPGAMIIAELNDELSQEGFTYEEDIEPWLGQTAGLFLTDFSDSEGNGAALISVTDTGGAEDAINKAAEADDQPEEDKTYEGQSYKVDPDDTAIGVVGDFLVAGTEEGFKAAVDASAADSLADDETASSALDNTTDDSLFRVYVDTERAVDLAVDSGLISQEDLDAAGAGVDQLKAGPVVMSGGATADSMSIETSAPEMDEGTETTDIVSTLPSGSWLAFGAPMVGEAIAAGYDSFVQGLELGLSAQAQGLEGDLPGGTVEPLPQADVPDIRRELKRQLGIDLSKDLAWMGDVGVFVEGSSLLSVGGGMVIETDDPDAASDAVAQIGRALARRPDVQVRRTADGFQVQSGPAGAEVSVGDDKVVIAAAGVTVEDVLSPSETLADSESFQSASGALGDDLTAAMFVDFPAIVALIEGSGQTGSPEYQQVKPVLDALDYMIAGSGSSDGRAVGRVVLGLKEGGGSSDAPAAALQP